MNVIGSFHQSQSLPILLEDDSKRCKRPDSIPYFPIPSLETGFGKDYRKYFCFPDPSSPTFLNHGAFGAPLKFAFEETSEWNNYIEKEPVSFFDRELFSHWCSSLASLGSFLDTSPKDMVLLPNATYGIWSVLSSEVLLQPCKEHVVVYLDIIYGATKKMIKLLKRSNPKVEIVEISIPIQTRHDMVDSIISQIPSNATLVILDHITSTSAICLPIAEISSKIKTLHRDVHILVDGAHAPGMISELSPSSMNIDFYVGNCHKWLCNPRGVGFMWVKPLHHSNMFPAVPSHGISEDDLQSRFVWVGNQDYSSALVLKSVLDWWSNVGPSRIYDYCKQLSEQTIEMFCNLWQVSREDSLLGCISSDERLLCNSMVLFRVHTSIPQEWDTRKLQDWLFTQGYEVPVKNIAGRLYLRLSFHVYNYLEEYEALCKTFLLLSDF